MQDGEDDTGAAGVGAGGELVSPDSGMTTIRSSRSSKESSVFLSDDSPVGEAAAGAGSTAGPAGLFLRNPSPLGLSSLSPPVPPERRKNRSGRNKSDNFDLFSFDPLQSGDPSLPTGGDLTNSKVRGDGGQKRAESSSFSELEELSLLDFSAPGFESRHSSADQHGQIHGNDMSDTVVPPTPVNSVVGSRPPSSCGVRFFPEDVVERISGLQHKDSVSSSLSETWDELGFDSLGALSSSENSTWNRGKEPESPPNIMEEIGGTESLREEILKSENSHQRGKTLEPQLSLITEQTESYDNWNAGSAFKDQWNTASLTHLQLTPPEEDVTGKFRAVITGVKEKTSSVSRKKAVLNTLTPDTSKEEDEGAQGKKEERQMELLDFWTYSAQKGFLKSDSGTTTSYPESLDMWNMTIRDDSLSPLTTPDNLSETSGSFCGANPTVGRDASAESPQGFSDGGMMMWNTTIQEDSSSTITSPEGPENEKDLSHMGSLEASESPEAHAGKQLEEEKLKEEEIGYKVHSQTLEEVSWRGNEHNVKIVIEEADEKTQGEMDSDIQEPDVQNLASGYSEGGASSHHGTDMWDLPVPGMVSSTSEYDNVGAGTWSLSSSPETFSSPMVDMIQLEEQSSPFVALTNPVQDDKKHDRNQRDDSEYRPEAEKKPANQVFLFETAAEAEDAIRSGRSSAESKYDNKSVEGSEEADWMEQQCDHSPFVLVDYSMVAQDVSANYHSHLGEDREVQMLTSQSSSPSHGNHYDLPAVMAHDEDRSATESKGALDNESAGNGKPSETMSLSSSSGGDRDTLKYSPDSLQPGSRDELRSNSDGDSSSGLEMESIIVSGTVKEDEREWPSRSKPGDRQSKGTRKSMETFCTLSYAATVLQTQAQASQREHQGSTEQNREKRSTDGVDTDQASLNNVSECHHAPPEMSSSETSHPSDTGSTGLSQTQVEEGGYEDKSSFVPRSVSPSLRYPSDHFLKTREEVYVHSQISMEDSDEGGQSPTAVPSRPTSLSDFKAWTGQLARQDTPQTTSEPHSPELTNSSVSHASSLIDTPMSESGVSAERGLGLPFSGDLMEEENDEGEQEEDTEWTLGVETEREEGHQQHSSDLLSFTEELIGGTSCHQTDLHTVDPKSDRFLQKAADYCDEQPMRTVKPDVWSMEQQTEDHKAAQDSYSPVLR